MCHNNYSSILAMCVLVLLAVVPLADSFFRKKKPTKCAWGSESFFGKTYGCEKKTGCSFGCTGSIHKTGYCWKGCNGESCDHEEDGKCGHCKSWCLLEGDPWYYNTIQMPTSYVECNTHEDCVKWLDHSCKDGCNKDS